jgi:hypothetical protein
MNWKRGFQALPAGVIALIGERLHIDRLVEASAGKMCQPACIVAISLVRRQRLQCLVGRTSGGRTSG